MVGLQRCCVTPAVGSSCCGCSQPFVAQGTRRSLLQRIRQGCEELLGVGSRGEGLRQPVIVELAFSGRDARALESLSSPLPSDVEGQLLSEDD